MLKSDLILRNPLRLLGPGGESILKPGGFGAILARAGVGKTALIVQLALDTLLQEKNVLHISLNEPVGKVNLWYREVFGLLAQYYQISQKDDIWDDIVRHRFIMTFKVEGFSAPKLEERLTDLTAQKIFLPDLMIIDGMPFGDDALQELRRLKGLTERFRLPIWFTITTHRHEPPADDGMPVQFHPIQEFFDAAVTLDSAGEEIRIKAIKGANSGPAAATISLDPTTMLIRAAG